MKKENKEIEKFRLTEKEKKITGTIGDSYNGFFEIPVNGKKYTVIASNGCGWEHVSVSNEKHIPSWIVMNKIKNLFWDKNETVVQFHPAESEYVNIHPNCLHLWKEIGKEYSLPRRELI